MKRWMVFMVFLFAITTLLACNKNSGEPEVLFRVSFEVNGGESIPSLDIVQTGPKELPVSSKVGHQFLGWYQSDDFSGEPLQTITVTASGSLLLYARWVKASYTIDFESNGGSVISTLTYLYETLLVNDFLIPIKPGYDFSGWFFDVALSEPFTSINMPADNLTLYAKWTPALFTLSFDSQGGSTIESMNAYYQESISAPTIPTKFRHTFLGWYLDDTCTISFVFNTMPSENLTLYAKWLMHDYAVDFYLVETSPKQTAMSQDHTLLLTTEGKVYAWGNNQYGQLGNGTLVSSSIPMEVTAFFELEPNDFMTYVQVGSDHSYGVSHLGRIFAWGKNDYVQFGNGATVNSKTPLDVTHHFRLLEDEVVMEIGTSEGAYVARTSQGRVMTWGGFNTYGQLGDDATYYGLYPIDITRRFVLNNDEVIVKVQTGYRHLIAFSSHNRVFTWGSNDRGQLGNNSDENQSIPIDITAYFSLAVDEGIIDISAGSHASMVLTSHNRLFTFGAELLANNTSESSAIPIDVTEYFLLDAPEKLVSLYSGYSYAYALTSFNRVFGWGKNYEQQLADGTTEERLSPIDLTTRFVLSHNESLETMTLGVLSASAITNKGRVFVWGNNANGRLGDNTQITPTQPITLPFLHSIEYLDTAILNTVEGVSNYPIVSTGYHFFGWFHDLQMTNPYIDTEYPAIHETVYGRWIPDVYRINYHLEGGINSSINPTSYQIISDEIIFTPPMKEGHQFMGWYEDADYSGHIVESLPKGSFLDKDFYAKWEVLNYDVYYYTVEDTLIDIKTGMLHVVALSLKGEVYVFGNNTHNQLGHGLEESDSSIYNITDLFTLASDDRIVKIYVGDYHSLAISASGRIFMWGWNGGSNLGLGNKLSYTTPQEITHLIDLLEGETIKTAVLGYMYTVILTTNNRVFSWGESTEGVLGDGTSIPKYFPYEVTPYLVLPNQETIETIVGGAEHLLILTSNGALYGLGKSEHGSLGTWKTENYYQLTEITDQLGLNATERVTKVYSRIGNSFIQTSHNRTIAMGLDALNFTDNYVTQRLYAPAVVFDTVVFHEDEEIKSIAVSRHFALALTTQGRLFVLGDNYAEPLDFGQLQTHTTPYEITDLLELIPGEIIVKVIASPGFAFAITSHGRTFSWGLNSFGQLGNGLTTPSYQPIDVTFINEVHFVTQRSIPYNSSIAPLTLSRDGFTHSDWYHEAGLFQALESCVLINNPKFVYSTFTPVFNLHLDPIEDLSQIKPEE